MKNAKSSTNGFTIVELLIVIIIIAILAAMALGTFRGTQARAETSRILSEARTWKQAIQAYKAQTGTTLLPGPSQICLGDSLPAADGFIANNCMMMNGNPTGVVNSPSAMTTLRTVISKIPSPQTVAVVADYTSSGWGTWKYRGIMYMTDGTNDTVYYYVFGDRDCGTFTKSFDAPNNITHCSSQF